MGAITLKHSRSNPYSLQEMLPPLKTPNVAETLKDNEAKSYVYSGEVV